MRLIGAWWGSVDFGVCCGLLVLRCFLVVCVLLCLWILIICAFGVILLLFLFGLRFVGDFGWVIAGMLAGVWTNLFRLRVLLL